MAPVLRNPSPPVPKERFCFEERAGDDFDDFFDFLNDLREVTGAAPALPLPREGGILEERLSVILPDGVRLSVVETTRDIAGWRALLTEYCERTGRMWGVWVADAIEMGDARSISLAQCELESW